MNRYQINLTPEQNSIQGLFGPDSMVLVICDCTDGDIFVEMADAQSTDTVTFRFIKSDSSLNIVRLTAKANQKIMKEDFQELTEEADELVLNSDGENWW